MTKTEGLVRSFICINIPEEWAKALHGVSAQLKGVRSRISWTKSYHLTLKFLGEISPATLDKVRGVLEEGVVGTSSFSLSLGDVGCFPGPLSPRVLWVGVTTREETLSKLQSGLDKKLERIGFRQEKKNFTPHLTLGRIRRLEASDRLGERIRRIKSPEACPHQVNSVELMQSLLGRQGAQYSVLASFSLGEKPAVSQNKITTN